MDDATMEVDNNYPSLPDGTESGFGVVLSRQEERELARDTTANFAGASIAVPLDVRS